MLALLVTVTYLVYDRINGIYTAVELRTGVFAGEETPVLNQSEV
jgi:hypothetical protein